MAIFTWLVTHNTKETSDRVNPFREEITRIYPIDSILQTRDKYKVVKVSEGPIKEFIVSYTSIPPSFNDLINIDNTRKTLVNIPKKYRFYQSKNIVSNNLFKVNEIPLDYGPASKLIGLCSATVNEESILYGDPDIDYNFDGFTLMTKHLRSGIIIGTHGGYYHDSSLNQSTIGADLVEWAYQTSGDVFTEVDVIYGFGGVLLLRDDLYKICNHIKKSRFWDCPACFMIDDEWLSFIFKELNFRLITTRRYKTVRSSVRSENNKESNRKHYLPLMRRCLPCMSHQQIKVIENKPMVETFFEVSDSLHPTTEIEEMRAFIKKQFMFCSLHGLKYVVHHENRMKKAHWMKIWIIRRFLNNCLNGEVLFYTDVDFIFLTDKFPEFAEGKSLIMSRGCSVDYNHLMVGNILIKCDRDLIPLINIWEETTKILSGAGEVNDDQIAFNIISPRYSHKIQVEPILIYDDCYPVKDVIGVHFPGRDKLNRLSRYSV